MKFLVIGSNSFSGSHFISLLLEKGYEVKGISRSAEKKKMYLPYKDQDLSNFEFFQMDLNKDMGKIQDLIQSFQPEIIVNFASQSMVGQSWDNPDHWYQTNVVSTVKLIHFLKDKKFLKKYVHISTPEVYGTCKGNVTEDAPYNPSTPYAGSRMAADQFIQMYVKTFDFPAVFTRAANVYGPGQQLFKIITRSIIYMKLGKKIPLHGGGHARRSFIHIRDVCEGTLDVAKESDPGEIFHLSTDDLHSIRDLVKTIAKLMGKSFEDTIEDVETRLGLDDAYILDSTRMKKKYGWSSKIDIEKGIKQTIEWVDDNWDEIKKENLDYEHKP